MSNHFLMGTNQEEPIINFDKQHLSKCFVWHAKGLYGVLITSSCGQHDTLVGSAIRELT